MIRAAAIALLLAACGPDTAVVDGGNGGGDSSPTADASIAFPRQGGQVSVGLSVGAASTNLAAGFWKTTVGGAGCTRRAQGPCTVTVCGDEASAGVYAVAAGTITATGATTSMTIMSSADGQYAGASDSTTPFPSGSTVTIAAAGADVAAFSRDLRIPYAVAVTEPASTMGVVVDRAIPFTFRWTPGSGNVYLYLDSGAISIYPLSNGGTIRCVVPSADGELVIPTTALADLPPGMGTMAATGIEEVFLDVGGFEVLVRAITYDFVGTTTVQ